MIQIADWAHAGYEAALRRDTDGVLGVIADVIADGEPGPEVISGMWIDRTLTVLARYMDMTDPTNMLLKVDYEPDDVADPGIGFQLTIPPPVYWTGKLFAARATDQARMWDRVWENTPDDPQALTEWLRVLVGTMALTAQACTESRQPIVQDCCQLHVVHSSIEPMTLGARTAVAHLN